MDGYSEPTSQIGSERLFLHGVNLTPLVRDQQWANSYNWPDPYTTGSTSPHMHIPGPISAGLRY